MKANETEWPGSRVIVGEMQDEVICVRTGTGRVLRLSRDMPPSQRAGFFERMFAEARNDADIEALSFRQRYA